MDLPKHMHADDPSALRRLSAALDAAGDLAYVWEFPSDILYWQGSALAGFGFPALSTLTTGKKFAQHLHPDDLALRQNRLDAHISRAEPFECEYRVRGEGGVILWVQDRGSVEWDTAAGVRRMYGILRPITRHKQQEQRLEQLASYDELTGHLNKTGLRQALDRIVAASQRSGGKGAYLSIGIDKLATINDAFGPEAADQVITEIGQRLDRHLRTSDVIGRVGGDRFGVALADCAPENIVPTAEKILAAVSLTPIVTGAGSVYATVSIGGAVFRDQVKTSGEAMARAETALAEAKRAGRDCFVAYRLSEDQRSQQRVDMALGERVQRALKENRLVFAYQPVVDSLTGAADYYECLLRMVEEDGSVIAAGSFVHIMEQLGLIRLLDRYVLERAIDEVAQHPGITLAFNVSGLTTTDRSWLRAVVAMLRDRREIANRLIVEITETAALADINESVRFVNTLKELGCRVALDDFGAGFTSLRHLQALAVDHVKIDGSFVRNVADSYDDQVFLRHLVGLANGLNLITVAEGVETMREAAILRREGVQFQQGYYFGKPTIECPWREVSPARPPIQFDHLVMS